MSEQLLECGADRGLMRNVDRLELSQRFVVCSDRPVCGFEVERMHEEGRALSVHVPAVADLDDVYSPLGIKHGIDYPVISHPDAPEILFSFKFPTSVWPRINFELIDFADYPLNSRGIE